ncbi:MAG: tetratricopeptide repeat protein [Elusimicrobia bacterium]|nr:tetratricopeptide repeat protein [Elusimicrobiota bacterium]
MTPSRGVELFNRGDYAAAARAFEAELRRGPPQEWLVCALGQAYASGGRIPDALRLLRRAAHEARDPHPVYLAISDILRRAGQVKKAEALLRRLAGESSHLGQAHHALGQILLGQGRRAAAAACFRKAARLEPELPWPHMALGELLDQDGRPAAARRCWDRAGRARLCDAATAVQLGDVYGRQGLPGRARRQYQRAWKMDRGGAPGAAACQKLAEAAKSRGDLKAAALWLERAGRLEPKQALWDFRRGWVLGQAGRRPEMRRALRAYLCRPGAKDGAAPILAWVGLEDYRRAARAADKVLAGLDPEGLSALSRAWPENWLRQHGDEFYARHLTAVRRQGRAMPRSPWPLFFQAALHLRRNRSGEAGALAARLARFPAKRYGWMRYVTGLACLLACRYEDAVREFSAALESRPEDWKARCHLAEALLCRGRRDEAFVQFGRAETAAAKAGAAPEVWAWRGEARLWLGEAAAALEDLDRAVEAGAKLALCWRGAARLLAGSPAAARRDLDRAIVPGSRDWEALLWRAELHRRAGRPGQARRDLEAGRRANRGHGDCEWAACNRALLPGAEAAVELNRLPKELLAAASAALGTPVPATAEAGRVFARAWLERARGLRRHEPYLRALWLEPKA